MISEETRKARASLDKNLSSISMKMHSKTNKKKRQGKELERKKSDLQKQFQ